jgi:hypothetical protein
MDDPLTLNPADRRRWLLTKALEIAPLGEALALAQAADDFLSGAAVRTGDRTSSEVAQAPAFGAGPEAIVTQPKPFSALPVSSHQPPSKAGGLVGLSSLASIDDVILYLRQHDEVFAEDESAEGLLLRANLKRTEQGLPPFALLPTPPSKAIPRDEPEKVVLPRPPSGRERAEWARRVVALAAD